MKALLRRFLKCRLAQAGVVCAIIATVAVLVGWSGNPEARARLGGVWVGELAGVQWISTYAPLDANGKTAAITIQWSTLSGEFLALAASFGVDRNSQVSGTIELINKDTAKYMLLWYGVQNGSGTATPPVGDKVKTINIMTGTAHYTSPDTMESTETYKVYVAEPGHTLLPAPDAEAVFTVTFPLHTQYRVTMP